MGTVRPIEEIAFQNAHDFLRYLQLSAPHWGDGPAGTWVFRGQGNADWPLLPSAWRDPWHSLLRRLSVPSEAFLQGDAKRIASLMKYVLGGARSKALAKIGDDAYIHNVASLLVRTAGEAFAVDQFVRLSDEVGLRIPSAQATAQTDYVFRLRALHIDSVINGGDDWLNPTFDDTFGLAQHHGVPTRLLDFTNRSFVAAFFAARDPKGSAIAVWAIDLIELLASRIRTLTCRRYDNTFLHAQDGVFLYDYEAPHDYVCTGEWPALETALAAEDHDGKTVLRKVTLPATQAKHLLRLLWRERMSPAHLMPTYDNIAAALPTYWSLLDDSLRRE